MGRISKLQLEGAASNEGATMIDDLISILPEYIAADCMVSQASVLMELTEAKKFDEELATNIAQMLELIAIDMVVVGRELTDLEEAGFFKEMEPDLRQTFESIFSKLVDLKDSLSQALGQFQLSQGLLPRLVGFEAHVDAKVLWKDEQPTNFIPFASVKMEFDSGTVDTLAFQASDRTVRRLIEVLTITEQRLQKVSEQNPINL